ncbi:acyltransferase [Paraburkholderia phytofirmans]|jgi:phenylacetic acid degradation protein|uniref:acyltransferase n=1 Tax=Paraburkholderia phytofirmans TaxID=261302 RepID=UPI0038B891A1
MALYEFNGKRPRVDPSAYVHPGAVLIGDVTVGACCYIGPFASLRGDFGAVVVERGSNVQDACVLHTGVDNTCRLGVDSHIGHGAIVHGATLEPNTMVGMHAVVMDGAVLGEASIVAACAFVKKDWHVPPRVLVAGVPGRVVRRLDEEEIRAKSSGTRVYQQLAADCLRTMRSV